MLPASWLLEMRKRSWQQRRRGEADGLKRAQARARRLGEGVIVVDLAGWRRNGDGVIGAVSASSFARVSKCFLEDNRASATSGSEMSRRRAVRTIAGEA